MGFKNSLEAIVTTKNHDTRTKLRQFRKLFLLLLIALIAGVSGSIMRAAGSHKGVAVGNDRDRDDDRGRDRDDRDDNDRDNDRESYAIGLWGDLPYSDAQALTGVPNMIKDMNSQDLAFTAHDGDLKAGSGTPGSVAPSTCTDALYLQGLNYFNSLKAPVIFTPGDNDWTDCDRASNGGFNSRERLDHERQLFFSTPLTLGQHHFVEELQTAALCLDARSNKVPCVENRRFTLHGVTYIVLNVQGSCNNLCDTNPDHDEWAARNAADIAWLQDGFAKAKQRNSAAVMIISQADPGFDAADGTRAPVRNPKTLAETDLLPLSDPFYNGGPGPQVPTPDGFQTFLIALRQQVIAFGKPVAYVNGDSHYFRIDKPFLDSTGARIANFTRVETFGDNQANGTNDCNWLKVFVDPNSREVFTYQQQIVPANKVVLVP
jgi:hypothetical protein